MFLVRRVFKVKPGTTRKAAEVIAEIGKMYEEAGLRAPSRVFISGTSTPGPLNTVYMEWLEETLGSPHREGNPTPDGEDELFARLNEYQEETTIEFYELYSGA